MSKFALCVGINEFEHLPQNNWLYGCVNDAEDFVSTLTGQYGFTDNAVTLLTNAAATKDAVLGELDSAVARAERGELEHLVFTFSSHGTQVPDLEGEEPDHADEAFVTYDMGQNGDQWDRRTLIIDDELHGLFARIPQNVLLDVVLDTCHSGTGLKSIDLLLTRKPKFLPPPTPLGLDQVESADPRAFRDLVKSSDGGGHPVLFAACRSDQTAADARFGDRYNGAFTYFFLKALSGNKDLSRGDLLKKVSGDLRGNRFPQRAQLEAPVKSRQAAWGTA
jgi:metacaspase-1